VPDNVAVPDDGTASNDTMANASATADTRTE
jgi:hypothetical protein